MCVVSMIGDHYFDKWKDYKPSYTPQFYPTTQPNQIGKSISREEFDELKKEVKEMKELLKRAVKYDEDNNQRDCEIKAKVEFLRQMAEMVGITLDDVFPKK